MKKLIVLFCLFVVSAIKAQAPQSLNYQAIARDASGNIITTAIGIKFEILQGSASGTLVYEETNNITPSSVGVFTAAIGSGAASTGTFAAINWANSPYFIRVSIDPAGGTSYSTVGTSQLLSVPYALYAETAGNTQTVSISGPGVTGSYPNYTITPPGALTPSTGISIIGGTITNTAPNPTLVPSGITSITGTHPSFTIDVPPPALNYNTGTNVLTLTQGTAVATTTLVGAGSNTVAMFAQGIASVTPVGAGSNFTVSVQSPSFTSIGSTTVSGTYPNYTVTSPGASTLTPTSLQINSPHTTTTLSPNNFSINVVPTNISGPGVLGAYPNYTLAASPSTTVTSGSPNVIVNGTAPSYTISATTPTLQINAPNTITPLGLNNYSITVPPTNIGLVGVGVASVSGTSPNYTVTVPGPSLTVSGNSLTITQGTVVSTKTITTSPWTSGAGVIYSSGSVLNDNVAIGQSATSSNLEVANNAGSTNTINPVVSISNANTLFSASSVLQVRNTNGGGAVIMADNTSTGGDGISVNLSNAANGSTALQVSNAGIGYAGYFSNTNTSSNARVLDLSNSGRGGLIYGTITNTLNIADAIYINTNGTGSGINLFKNGTGYGISVNQTGTGGTAGYFNISNASNGSQALSAQTGGSGEAVAAYNTGSGRAFYASGASASDAAYITNSGSGRALNATNTGTADATLFQNLGTGRAVYATNNNAMETGYFVNTGTGRSLIASNSSTSETALFSNSSNGRGIVIQNSGFATVRAAQIIGGLDVMGKGSSSATWAAIITSSASTNLFNVRDDGNVGINVSNPGYRLSVNEGNGTLPAIYATQSSAAGSANAHGIMGLTSNSNTFAAGVHGESTGSGPAVSGNKPSGSGPAGRFEINTTTNTADGIFATTFGGGAAIHAVNGPTVSGSSNAAVWLESGHLKSTQLTAPTTNSVSVSGGGIQGISISLSAGSTDVKGVMMAVLTTTGIINSANNATVRVTFNKVYTVPPVVVVTSLTDLGLMSFFVNNVTTSSFNLTIRNSTSGNMSAGASFPLNFNYMVIE